MFVRMHFCMAIINQKDATRGIFVWLSLTKRVAHIFYKYVFLNLSSTAAGSTLPGIGQNTMSGETSSSLTSIVLTDSVVIFSFE